MPFPLAKEESVSRGASELPGREENGKPNSRWFGLEDKFFEGEKRGEQEPASTGFSWPFPPSQRCFNASYNSASFLFCLQWRESGS